MFLGIFGTKVRKFSELFVDLLTHFVHSRTFFAFFAKMVRHTYILRATANIRIAYYRG